jgi:predicted nucleotidyltransferase component of viral defense system
MFHLSTVEKETFQLLQQLFTIDAIAKQFALAGGTSLALQIGHRKSIDLDLFSFEKFDPKELEIILSSHPSLKFTYVGNNSRMLFCFINDIKCDFVHEPAKLIKPFLKKDEITYFSVEDIAAMKMHTVCGRGKKKDFFDIYALLELYSWPDLLQWFEQKYGNEQMYILWRSVAYFEDADQDPDIQGINPFSKNWVEIKKTILAKCNT